jgi:hypothetical protein
MFNAIVIEPELALEKYTAICNDLFTSTDEGGLSIERAAEAASDGDVAAVGGPAVAMLLTTCEHECNWLSATWN